MTQPVPQASQPRAEETMSAATSCTRGNFRRAAVCSTGRRWAARRFDHTAHKNDPSVP